MADDATPAQQEGTPPSGGRSASELRSIADDLRGRLDLYGKLLAAVATLGTTAVGLSRISDLDPSRGDWGWVLLACLGLAIAALAVITLAIRLMYVGSPIFLSVDPDNSSPKLKNFERDELLPVFRSAAQRFHRTSLQVLEVQERSIRRNAYRTSNADERIRRLAEADEIKTEIEQALARAQLVAIRGRSIRAVRGRGAWPCYGAFVAGLLLFAVPTNIVSSDHKDRVDQAKTCADARKAGATDSELERAHGICDPHRKESPRDTGGGTVSTKIEFPQGTIQTLVKSLGVPATKDLLGRVTDSMFSGTQAANDVRQQLLTTLIDDLGAVAKHGAIRGIDSLFNALFPSPSAGSASSPSPSQSSSAQGLTVIVNVHDQQVRVIRIPGDEEGQPQP